MEFSNSTTLTGLIQEVDRICNTSDNTFSLKAKTARLNIALDRFFTLAFQADGRWSFDDLNQTTAPLESISLVSGTEKYAIDTFTSEIINILRVEALNSAGTGIELHRFDPNIVNWESLPQYNSVAGTPQWYSLLGKFIYLYPKPSYSVANGLSLYFERNKVAFVSTDTTKVPGIPSIFHEYLCRYASLQFLIEKQKPQKNDIAAQIALDESAILAHFSHREKGLKTRIQPRWRSNR